MIPADRGGFLLRYSLLSLPPLLLHHALYLRSAEVPDFATLVFVIGVAATGPLILAAAALAPAWILHALLRRREGRVAAACVAGTAVAGATVLQVLLFFDRTIYAMFGFHLNGFVWNLLTTPGGLEALDAGPAVGTAVLIMLGFLGLQAGLVIPALRGWRWPFAARRTLLAAVLPALLLLAGEKFVYGSSRAFWHRPVIAASEVFPLYRGVDLTGPARALGQDVVSPPWHSWIPAGGPELDYPLAGIRRDPARPKYNIVWLIAECLRADVLTPEIMPAVSAFADRAVRFRRHYSGGNATRLGVFSMFYGLHGTYWYDFQERGRGPVLMDLLAREGYAFDCRAASFSWPEFDCTVFSVVPRSRLQVAEGDPSWVRDRANVDGQLEFIDRRDPAQPFFAFLFLDATHARYSFPEESDLGKDYEAPLDYLGGDFTGDIEPVRKRYLNCCRHIDTEMGRILERLEQRNLLSSTIVLITGDHGEEFMEKGRWGHASALNEEQTRTPMVLWVPGRAPAGVDRISSHLDLPATVMTALGVTNPPGDYSLGVDLLGADRREEAVIVDRARIQVVDAEGKVELDLSGGRMVGRKVTTLEDAELPDPSPGFARRRDRLMRFLREMNRFRK